MVMPPDEAHRRAVRWIDGQRRENPQKSVQSLVDEAGMRFNLGPCDCAFLCDFFTQREKTAQPDPAQDEAQAGVQGNRR